MAGPTGGYLVGFIFMALIAGFLWTDFREKECCRQQEWFWERGGLPVRDCMALRSGQSCPLAAGLVSRVIPYVPGDLIKIAAALAVGPVLRKAVRRAA